MRIYKDCNEAYSDLERELVKFGKTVKTSSHQNRKNNDDPQFYTKELQNYSFSIIDPNGENAINGCLESHQDWVRDEIDERLFTDANPGENWKKRADYWSKYMNEHGQFDYTYAGRMRPYLQEIIQTLNEDPYTRRAVLSLWDQQIDGFRMRKEARVSCSLYYQLMFRDGKLDIIYAMRSCDFYEHFRNDVALAILFRNFICTQTNMQPGRFMMNIGSFHAYNKDLPQKSQVV